MIGHQNADIHVFMKNLCAILPFDLHVHSQCNRHTQCCVVINIESSTNINLFFTQFFLFC